MTFIHENVKQRLVWGTLFIILLMDLGTAHAQEKSADVIINGNNVGRRYGGIGAIAQGGSARLLIDYPEPERSQILDYLFKQGYGASLQLLKVGIGSDTNGTDGAEPSHMRGFHSVNCKRGWEWWLMEEAKRRNPNIKLLAQGWGAPGWIGNVWSDKSTKYQLTWLKCADQHGLTIDYIGGWNEQGFKTDKAIAFTKAVKKIYRNIKIPGGDDRGGSWAIADSMEENEDLKNAIDVIDVHSPCRWRSHYTRCHSPNSARELGTPLWLAANAAEGGDAGGPGHTRVINRMYLDAKMTGYMTWNLVESRYGNLPLANTGLMGANWPWSGYYQLGKNLWAFAHTTQFTEPGWHYLNSGSKRLNDGATIVSLTDSASNDYSMILEAVDVRQPDTLSFQIKNLPDRVLHVWRSNLASDDSADHFQDAGTISPHKGHFTLTIQPNYVYSITSTTGQGKGHARPKASIRRRLSLPYAEDFEGISKDRMAPLYTTINGAFEATPCKDRPGMCYQQAVNQQPIIWNKTGKMPPTVMVGDPRWWGDYSLQTDVRLDKVGYAELVGRISGQTGWTTYLGGYHFQVGIDGYFIKKIRPVEQEIPWLQVQKVLLRKAGTPWNC